MNVKQEGKRQWQQQQQQQQQQQASRPLILIENDLLQRASATALFRYCRKFSSIKINMGIVAAITKMRLFLRFTNGLNEQQQQQEQKPNLPFNGICKKPQLNAHSNKKQILFKTNIGYPPPPVVFVFVFVF
uniref:Uncharacterized protein n=1 Tax=Glossina brevipalpis TaxID=37001 RepID=A0A1A9WT04_9MUSC